MDAATRIAVEADSEAEESVAAQEAGPDEVDVDAATRAISSRDHRHGQRASPGSPPEPGATPDSGDPPPDIGPKSVLFGEYEIIEVLGAGGMGEVYRARHRSLDEPRAIKMMHAELSGKKGANEFFLREAKALLAVRHPAVVHCHDLLSEKGRVYLIMEMIEGVSLSQRMEQGALSPDEVVVLGARLAAGLSAAHACGVVHRDVSPDNVVLPGGDVAQAKLIDFGIAKILQEGQGTIVAGFKGKLGYASPEQLGFFGGRIDGRSDFYSLGLVLCAAALGRSLGMGATMVEAVDARRHLHRVPDEIPIGLRSAIEPLLALDPDDRPEMVERLFLAPGSVSAGSNALHPGIAARERRGASRFPGLRWLPVVSLLAAAVGLAGYLLLGDGSGQTRLAARSPEPASESVPGVTASERQPAPRGAGEAKSASVGDAGSSAGARGAGAEPAREPKPPTKTVSALDRVRIVGLLRGAEAALAENRLQSPKGDNAYEKYIAVLDLDPDNRAARRGLLDVGSHYLDLTERALAAARLEQAEGYLARATAVAPHHPRLPSVREAVSEASRTLPERSLGAAASPR